MWEDLILGGLEVHLVGRAIGHQFLGLTKGVVITNLALQTAIYQFT